jgi:hypothetical protein
VSPARALVLVAALALVVPVAATWPLAAELGQAAPASPFTGGHVAALSVATRVPFWSTHTDLAGWPGGVDFRPLLWPSILLARLTGPEAAYGLTLLTTPLVNVLGGVILGRALRFDGRAPVALGALLAFPPWVRTTLQNGQPEQALLGVGAMVVALGVWSLRGAAWRPLLVAPVVALAGVSAPHVVLAALGVLAAAVGLGGEGPGDAPGPVTGGSADVARASRRWGRRAAVLAAAALGAAAVARYHTPGFDRSVAHFFAPFGLLDADNGPVPKRAVMAADLFAPARRPPGRGPWVVHLGYVGVPLLAAAITGVRRAPWALVAAGGLLICAFGDAGPYGLLARLSPALSASGTPYRFTLGVVLALAVLVCRTRVAWLVAALSVVEAAWVDPRPLPFERAALPVDEPAPELADTRGPVLDLPLVGRSCREGAAHYLAEAGRRDRESPLLLRSGDLAWGDALPDAQALDAAFRAPECVTKLGPLLEPYGAVVAHRHAGCRLETRVVSCLEGALGPGREHGDTTTWSR